MAILLTVASAIIATPVQSQTSTPTADAQVEAVFGIPPWNNVNSPGFISMGYADCEEGKFGFPLGVDLYTASIQCLSTHFDLSADFLRNDLGTDSSGSIPPSGKVVVSGPNGTEIPRCSSFFLGTDGLTNIVCYIWLLTPPSPQLIAANQTVKTYSTNPIAIDLSFQYIGVPPTSASLVGAPVGGTVSGFPNTTVTFTPNGPSGSPAGFKFTLSGSGLTSNTGTVYVDPTLLSPSAQATFLSIGTECENVSNAFEYAALTTESISGGSLAKNVGLYVGQKVFLNTVFGNDQLSKQGAGIMAGAAQFGLIVERRLTKTNALSIPLEVDSLIFSLCSLGANLLATDPPDPNFRAVAAPSALPSIATGNATLDQIEKDYLRYAALAGATLNAQERYEGAVQAGDKTSAALQEQAFNAFFAQMNDAIATLNADNTTLAATLPPVDVNSIPGGAATIASAYNAQCGTPLPKGINDQLLALPLTQDQINSAVCSYVSGITASSINTNFATALQIPLP